MSVGIHGDGARGRTAAGDGTCGDPMAILHPRRRGADPADAPRAAREPGVAAATP